MLFAAQYPAHTYPSPTLHLPSSLGTTPLTANSSVTRSVSATGWPRRPRGEQQRVKRAAEIFYGTDTHAEAAARVPARPLPAPPLPPTVATTTRTIRSRSPSASHSRAACSGAARPSATILARRISAADRFAHVVRPDRDERGGHRPGDDQQRDLVGQGDHRGARVRVGLALILIAACHPAEVPNWQPDAGACEPYVVPTGTNLMVPAVTFSADILTVLEHSCTSASCHGGASPQGELDLGTAATYANPRQRITSIATMEVAIKTSESE